jgi:hypothetical protein
MYFVGVIRRQDETSDNHIIFKKTQEQVWGPPLMSWEFTLFVRRSLHASSPFVVCGGRSCHSVCNIDYCRLNFLSPAGHESEYHRYLKKIASAALESRIIRL